MSVINKVMQTYGLMVNLSAADEAIVRERLLSFLKDKNDDDHVLTVEALKYLRGGGIIRKRRGQS